MNSVFFEIHFYDAGINMRGVLDNTYKGSLHGLKNAWCVARGLSELNPSIRHWVKTRPVSFEGRAA